MSFSALSVLAISGLQPALASDAGYPPNPNLPRTYYVSKNGDNSDGRSWKTAWNEMNQIRWTEVNAMRRDSIVLDGGEKRMVYQTPMVVQITPTYYPVTINVSAEAGHNGQVLIAPGNTVNGIEVASGGIQMNGGRRNGIRVHGAKVGLKVNSSAPYIFSIKNVEMSQCAEAGLSLSSNYYPMSLSQLVIHDNATNVVVTQASTPTAATLSKCWIYNSTYLVNTDGVRIDGSPSGPPMPGATFRDCVFGPGLRDGISNTSGARPSLTNCLLINATRKNIASYAINCQNVTSFMTRLNPSGQAHSCVKLQGTPYPYQPGSNIKQSIFFGGTVEIPTTINYPYPPFQQPYPLTVEQNTQFRTTGNTIALAPEMVNPDFVTPVGLLPNITPVALLMQVDFRLRPSSPATGTGCSITSVQNLLNSFD